MFIAKIEDNLYTVGSGLDVPDGDSYVVSFDFDSQVMMQLKGKIPDKAIQILNEPLADSLTQVNFVDRVYRVTVDSRVGEKLTENKDEIFLPLWINRILD